MDSLACVWHFAKGRGMGMRCNWEKVTQDKELLSKVEDWVRGLSIDSPQEIFDEMNRLTGNDCISVG